MKGSEAEFKARFRASVKGWSEAYEPGRGGGIGYPDLQVLVGPDERVPVARLVPVELKIAVLKGDKLLSRNIKPVQISWHYRLLLGGGESAFAFGVCEANLWSAYIFRVRRENFSALMGWREGIAVAQTRLWHWHAPDNVRILVD